MLRTRVGYCGGDKHAPTYESIGDHTESIQIDFDPEQISYRQLLEVFWTSHNPCAASGKGQYATILFTHDEEQQKAAFETRDAIAAKEGREVKTTIRAYPRFWPAEDYHQKYTLRNWKQVYREFAVFYPNARRFLDSTAAARVNGYLAGHGSGKQLEADLPRLGLSETAQKILRERVGD